MNADTLKKIVTILTALVAFLSAVLGTLQLEDGSISEGSPDTRTVTTAEPAPADAGDVPKVIAVDGADADTTPDDPVVLDHADREAAADFAEDPKDLQPEGLRGPDAPNEPVAKPRPPFAADSIPGCRTRFLTTNWSYRSVSQAQVVQFSFHFTGGPDKPGTRSEVDGLTAFGNQPSARVSWHFNMDKDGNCDYNVPLRYKAWTFGNANDTSINIEVHGVGDAPYLRPGGVRQLSRIIAAVKQAYPRAVKFQLGALHNCKPTRDGFVTHWMGGACSGGHTDIRPLDVQAIIRLLKSASCGPKCERRKRHVVVHRRLRELRCANATARARHPVSCSKLRTENSKLHRAGV